MTIKYTFENIPSNVNLTKILHGINSMKVDSALSISGVEIISALSSCLLSPNIGQLKFTKDISTLQWKSPGDNSYGRTIVLKESLQGRYIILPAEDESQAESEKGLLIYFASYSSLPSGDVEITNITCSWRMNNISCVLCAIDNDSDPTTNDPTTLTISFSSALDASDQATLQSWVNEIAGI